MKVIFDKDNESLILRVKGEYSVDTMEDILKLSESDELRNYKTIIVDFLELEYFDNCGTELYLLRSNFYKSDGINFLVLSKNEGMKTIVSLLKSENEKEFQFCSSLEEAKSKIKYCI